MTDMAQFIWRGHLKKTKKQTPAIFGNTIEKKKSLHEAVFKNIHTLERLKTLQYLNLIR